MAVQPIDLQVLFSRLNQLGKEQADQKDGRIHTQIVLDAESVKRTEDQDRSIREIQETEGANARRIKDENRRHRQGGSPPGGEKKEEEGEAAAETEIVHESYLGRKIDITG
ncbi:MAG: hypothetical protein LBT33_09605 [Spirochaetia bacterium]|jgi:hypothetical protein|nr:hypothetical protein [Spirochaetia bacterium]